MVVYPRGVVGSNHRKGEWRSQETESCVAQESRGERI